MLLEEGGKRNYFGINQKTLLILIRPELRKKYPNLLGIDRAELPHGKGNIQFQAALAMTKLRQDYRLLPFHHIPPHYQRAIYKHSFYPVHHVWLSRKNYKVWQKAREKIKMKTQINHQNQTWQGYCNNYDYYAKGFNGLSRQHARTDGNICREMEILRTKRHY